MSNSKTKHTSGPWVINKLEVNDTDGNNRLVAMVNGGRIKAESEANAQLIAAAPEMLEALEEIHERLFAWRDDAQLKLQNCEPRQEAKYQSLIANYGRLIRLSLEAITKARGDT